MMQTGYFGILKVTDKKVDKPVELEKVKNLISERLFGRETARRYRSIFAESKKEL